MNRRIINWLAFMVFVTSAAQGSGLYDENEICTDEDYATFSVAINWSPGLQKVDSLVINNLTVTTGYPLGLAARSRLNKEVQALYDLAPQGTIDNFDARNKNRVPLEVGNIKTQYPTFSISNEEFSKFFQSVDGWNVFHQKFPGTVRVVSMSRPGINRDHDRALLYMAVSCGPNCAGGTLLLLSKEDGKWKVMQTATTWRA